MPKLAKKQVLDAKAEILKKANDQDPVLNSFGGGAKDLDAKIIDTTMGQMLIVDLYVDCRDAMGANAVNTMAEAVAPLIEQLTGGHVYLRIISNLATKRLAKAWCTVPKEALAEKQSWTASLTPRLLQKLTPTAQQHTTKAP